MPPENVVLANISQFYKTASVEFEFIISAEILELFLLPTLSF